jgi:branched-chain amino acid transport system substrate-binding protein
VARTRNAFPGGVDLTKDGFTSRLDRRALLKAGAVIGAAQIASPFVRLARAAVIIKIGVDNPLSGSYAALGKNEAIGMQIAVDAINAKGGILGRQVELSVEDSTSGDAGVAVQKAHKLIDRDRVSFMIGNINSALAQAIANVANEKSVFRVVPGGHTDSVTGANGHWNTFRVCNATQTEASAVIRNADKKWYHLTPDYAFGHTLQARLKKAAAKLGGTKVGEDLTPLGTTDFSSYLIKA